MLLHTTWFGTFLLDPESGSVNKKKLFPKTVSKLAERLNSIQNQELLSEEKTLAKGVKETILVTEKRLQGLGTSIELVENLPITLSLLPEDFGFTLELQHEAMLELGKLRTREAIVSDFYIIQAVKGLDDLTQIANLLSERLHEWYGLHWPELENSVKENEYVDLISELGDRDTIIEKSSNEKLNKADVSDSVGVVFDAEDKSAVMGFAQQLNQIQASKSQLEKYIVSRMESLAPNTASLAGPVIGARLIALTGGLKRLSQVSSSTIQVLGAEKALFRHLRDGGLPPKHGILFQHPYLHNAPYWQRGKIARALAGKIAIAAKVDHNSDKIMSQELEANLKRRLEEIQKKYPKAPAKKPKKTRRMEKSKSFGRGQSMGKGKGKRTRRAGRGRGRSRNKSKRWD